MRAARGLTILAALIPSVAQAECQITKFLEIPVTMRGDRAIVSAKINGQDAQFILDSGAFFSTLSRASAAAYGLKLEPLPPNFRLMGINGATSASMTTVQSFSLGGATLPKIDFIVGGTDTGQVGLLGQNFLGLADVEYDLGHGKVTLLRPRGCQIGDLPYWAGTRPVSVLPIEARTARQTKTIATVTVNGVKLRAMFDSGSPGSVLTLAAAKRAGITPNSPGVVAAGFATGLGSRSVRKWAATFDRLIVGGESIPKPKIMISDAEFGDADMLIGADFFLTHHIYVANKMGKMVMTYEGGTVFGVSSEGASDETGKPLDLTDRSAAPTDAEGFARRGAAAMSGRRFEEAIADFDQAIARAPAEARFLRQRAAARLANRQPLLAAADLDKALSIAGDDIEARQMRAALKLGTRDPDGAREDILALDKLLPPTSGARLQLASMADAAGLQEVGLANENAWLKSHPEDAQRPTALNGRCWARAQLNRELKEALADCNAALKARPNTAAYLDSRALVKLRLGDLAGARADYDAAVQIQPHNAWSLFMRGVAKRRAGDAAGGEADRRAALAIAPDVARRAAKIGISD